MKRVKIISTLGIFVVIMPFLGIPSSWKNTLYVLFGVSIVILATHILSKLKKDQSIKMVSEMANEVCVQEEVANSDITTSDYENNKDTEDTEDTEDKEEVHG